MYKSLGPVASPFLYARITAHLDGNVEAHVVDDGAVVVMTTESSPEIKTHVDRVVVAQVAISDNTRASNTVVLDGDRLAAQRVVLSRAVLVKDARGHGDKRRVGVHVLEVGADAAGAVLAQDAVAFVGIAKAVDGAVGIVAVDGVAATRRVTARRRSGRAAVVGAGTAVAVLRAALARGAGSTSVAAVARCRRRGRRSRAAGAVVRASTAVAVLGAAVSRGAVGVTGALSIAAHENVGGGLVRHGGDKGGQREGGKGNGGVLHCGDGWIDWISGSVCCV